MHNDKELLYSRNSFKLIYTFIFTTIIIRTTRDKTRSQVLVAGTRIAAKVCDFLGALQWNCGSLRIATLLDPPVRTVSNRYRQRHVTFSAHRSVGRLDFVAALACLLPGELTVVSQAACFCRTVVGPPFVVVTQSHFTLFKNSSSK